MHAFIAHSDMVHLAAIDPKPNKNHTYRKSR